MRLLKYILTIIVSLDAGSSVAASCSADSEISLKDCIASARANPAITEILISSNISCASASCSYVVSGFTHPLTITGTTPTAGLKRSGNQSAQFVSIQNSNSISLKNLIIDDGAISSSDRLASSFTSCPPSQGSCFSAISISESTNITIDQVVVNGGKPMGIEIAGVNGLTISNSTIKDSWQFGLWFSNSSNNVDVKIENNTFAQNRSNAIIYSAKADRLTRNTIRNNLFYGNHYNAAFNTCGPHGSPAPCSGGQLAIEKNTDRLNIDNNIIRDGSMVIQGVIANGIEFAGEGISNVRIASNTIKNNTGYGIVKNDSSVKLTNIEISNNVISESATGSFRFPEASYLGTNAPVDLQIYNGGTVTTFNPWVIWAAVSGASKTTKVNLYTNGVFWGKGTGYSIPNSSDISFSLPSSLANDCNLNRDDCNFQVELYDESAASTLPGLTHARSSKVNIPLPAYRFNILKGGVVMSYNPWVIWLSTEGVVPGTTARLYADGNFWGTGSGYATPTSTSISFSLPSNTAPNGCNLNREVCNFEIELVHPNESRSQKYKMPLPAVK